MTRFLSNLAGLAFRSPESKLVVKSLRPDHALALVREPDNQWDENAIQVWVPLATLEATGDSEYAEGEKGIFIGYLEKLANGPIALDMDHGKKLTARVDKSYDDYDMPVKTGSWARPLIEIISVDAPQEDDEQPSAA